MRDDRGGFIFLIALFVLTGIATPIAVGMSRSLTEQLAARASVGHLQAFHLAEAGMDEALWEFNQSNANFLLGDPPAGEGWVAIDSTVDPACTTGLICRRKTILNNTVTVTVLHIRQSRPVVRVEGTNPITGTRMQLMAVLHFMHPDFRYALFGDDWLKIEGKMNVDSYDAQAGAYDPSTNRNEYGDIGTNGTWNNGLDPELHVTNPIAQVDGDAYITADTIVKYPDPWPDPPTSTITQQTQDLPQVQLPPTSDYPNVYEDVIYQNITEDCNQPRRYKTLQVHGTANFIMHEGCKLYIERPPSSSYPTSVTLVNPSGTSTATLTVDTFNSMNSNGSARFTVASDVDDGVGNDAPVTVFIKDGGFDFDGPGLVNETQLPEKFQLYATGASTSGQLAQTQDFYGVAYVEDTDANGTGAGDINIYRGSQNGIAAPATYHGALIAGGHIFVSDATTEFTVNVHYDESLRGLPLDGRGRAAIDGEVPYQLLFWQDALN